MNRLSFALLLLLIPSICFGGNVCTTGGQVPGFNVNEIGDINFSLGAGLQYGCMSAHNIAVEVDLAAQDTWYQVYGFTTTNAVNGNITIDTTEDHIIAENAGDYLILLGASVFSSGANNYELMARYNNGTVGLPGTTIHLRTAVAAQIESDSQH